MYKAYGVQESSKHGGCLYGARVTGRKERDK